MHFAAGGVDQEAAEVGPIANAFDASRITIGVVLRSERRLSTLDQLVKLFLHALEPLKEFSILIGEHIHFDAVHHELDTWQ